MFECSAQYATENLIKTKEESEREREQALQGAQQLSHTYPQGPIAAHQSAYLLMCALNYRQEYKAYPKRQSRGVKMDVERGEKREIFQSTFRRKAVLNQMVRCSHAEYRSETACVLKHKDTLISILTAFLPAGLGWWF